MSETSTDVMSRSANDPFRPPVDVSIESAETATDDTEPSSTGIDIVQTIEGMFRGT